MSAFHERDVGPPWRQKATARRLQSLACLAAVFAATFAAGGCSQAPAGGRAAARLTRAAEETERLAALTRTVEGARDASRLPAALARLEPTATQEMLVRGLEDGTPIDRLVPAMPRSLEDEIEAIARRAAGAESDVASTDPAYFCSVLVPQTRIACSAAEVWDAMDRLTARLGPCDECDEAGRAIDEKIRLQRERLAQHVDAWRRVETGFSTAACLAERSACGCVETAGEWCSKRR